MEKSAIQFLHRFKPELSQQPVGLSFTRGQHIIYTNEVVRKQLGYNSSEQIQFVHPFKLSPELQPDGQLSSTKSMLMMRKAKVLGSYSFPWVHLKADKTKIDCHIHLFDISSTDSHVLMEADLFAIWQFTPQL